jgi:hypothetical protein
MGARTKTNLSLTFMTLLTCNANHLFAAGSSESAVEAKALPHKIVATVKAGEYQKAISELRSFIKTEKTTPMHGIG